MYSINKTKPKKIRKYLIYPVAEGSFLAIFALFLTSITAYFIYHHALAAIRVEIKDGLLRTASGIAACLDGDQLALFDAPEKKDLPEYQDTIHLLQKARLATKHCTYLYINRMVASSVVFVVDPTPVDEAGKPLFTDEKNLEPSIPMTPYPGASTELIEALTEKTSVVTQEAYTDGWGTFYSAYVPIYDSENRIAGTLGADLKIDDMLARCAPIEEATKRAFFVSCVLAMLFGTLIWFTRRFSLQLNQSRFDLMEDYSIAKEFSDQTSVRLGEQLNRTAQIAKNVSDRLSIAREKGDLKELQEFLNLEIARLNSFSETLREVAALKCKRRNLEFENFEVANIQKSLPKALAKSCPNSENLVFEADKDIPSVLYGSVLVFEEVHEHIGNFFLKMFAGKVFCRTQLMDETNVDIVLRQTMEASTEGMDKGRLELLEIICKEIEEVDFFEEVELAEAVSLSVVRELIYLFNSEINVTLDATSFSISFETLFKKSLEEQEEGI